ncbi:uncharacterized protein SPSK_08079 [Sporothrix schenckii 1099-18]|uniref:Uncharacterized protein n=1 Tax=Sporothrix schenckii 1099-18 TaxID=1397361 RepID=A0A0F2MIA7_SPOSC|nr:uncharacterized protein SPSK_08079 [Sporothrix schenckii 1099-18]KJR88794.1 hypothetical protein SPSK_08079 [Sporothrix schenckii 1099-18]
MAAVAKPHYRGFHDSPTTLEEGKTEHVFLFPVQKQDIMTFLVLLSHTARTFGWVRSLLGTDLAQIGRYEIATTDKPMSYMPRDCPLRQECADFPRFNRGNRRQDKIQERMIYLGEFVSSPLQAAWPAALCHVSGGVSSVIVVGCGKRKESK